MLYPIVGHSLHPVFGAISPHCWLYCLLLQPRSITAGYGRLYPGYIFDRNFFQKMAKFHPNPPKVTFYWLFITKYLEFFTFWSVYPMCEDHNDRIIRRNLCSKSAIYFGSGDFDRIKRVIGLSSDRFKRYLLYPEKNSLKHSFCAMLHLTFYIMTRAD